MNLPNPKQQHEDNLTLAGFVGLSLVIYVVMCTLMGLLVYAANR